MADKPKGKTDSKPANKSGKSNIGIIRYFQETQDELRKVTWPSREETIRLSTIVLVSTIISAIVLGGLDFLFQRLAALLV